MTTLATPLPGPQTVPESPVTVGLEFDSGSQPAVGAGVSGGLDGWDGYMSEDFARWAPRAVGSYLYYDLGSTTIGQLLAKGIIPKGTYTGITQKKPDSLLLRQGAVVAVIEHKAPAELAKAPVLAKEIADKSPAAAALSNLLIITDGSGITYWINPHTREPILDESGKQVRTPVNVKEFENIGELDLLIQKIAASITATNNQISAELAIDPTPLARRLWQTIWVATGKAPIKCLYNVVELFIFKFISDLRILPDDLAFENIYQKAEADPSEALQFYARNTRKTIYELFPRGADGTTIINGTIFVNEQGEANLSQATLFRMSLQHLRDYEQEFGRFTKIDQQFKTKLYETFLKQEVEALGQYFTPRVLVQSVIRMAGIDRDDYQFAGKRFCDPFCGVGGFLLEMLNLNDSMRDAYAPNQQGTIEPGFVMHGFDKGFERDDERTIIMAKANMLIYLAELLFKNPAASPQFAAAFNETFHLFKDNLGTFGRILPEGEHYDTILSNPPYVTSGTRIIKEEIAANGTLHDFYRINALGLESIALEWIVNSLRPGGRAFVVVPDGILGRHAGKKLRDFLLDQCYVDAIVSLPPRTFFANFESTYILALTKKNSPEMDQQHPVFTYLVTAIGERLTSVHREAIADNYLPEMERLFHLCRSTGVHVPRETVAQFPRCKLIEVDDLRQSDHWVIDRRWTNAEKIALGIETAVRPVTGPEIAAALDVLRDAGDRLAAERMEQAGSFRYVDRVLGDDELFTIRIGKRVTKPQLVTPSETTVPVYSSNVHDPMGHIPAARVVTDYSHDSILWGIDGNFEFRLVSKGTPFDITDHIGQIQILEGVSIKPRFLVYQLRDRIAEESFDRGFRASLANMQKFPLRIPVNTLGEFDVEAQEAIADHHELLESLMDEVKDAKAAYDELFAHFMATTTQTLPDEQPPTELETFETALGTILQAPKG